MRTLRGAVLGALLAGLVLGGCSGADKPAPDPAQVLAAAKHRLDTTPGVHITLAADTLPPGVNGVISADGTGTHVPAFQGTLKVAAGGITADAQVVAIRHDVYAKLPFTTRFVRIDPRDYGAPEPADLMRTKGGLSSLLTATRGTSTGRKVRHGSLVVTEYTGRLPGRAVASVIPSASPQGTFHATFRIAKGDTLDQAVLSGPFYPQAADVTYTISFDRYGVGKKITAP
jgi:lipoprotein LprG